MHDLVELALKKNRLRHGAGSEAPALVEEITRLRIALAELAGVALPAS
jgi:hypothetical protein